MIELDEAPSGGWRASHAHTRSALAERFALDRTRLPVLAVSVLVFGAAWAMWAPSPPLALALGLWCGYSLAFAGIAWLARAAVSWRRAFAPALLVSLAVAFGALAGHTIERMLWPPGWFRSLDLARYAWHLAFVAALIAVPASQSMALVRQRQRAEAERARVTARLMALQAQIEPHFLFNTLAALRSLIRRDGAAAVGLLDRMTDFLRAVLPDARQTTSTLDREASIVDSYLSIMQARLGTRLTYTIEIAAAVREAPLPPLLLQPIVENAIKHGIEPGEAGGWVAVTARRLDDTLVIDVGNSGEPLADADNAEPARDGDTAGERLHTGTANVRSRLAALYGAHGTFELSRAADGTTLATLRLPWSAAR